jgi:hypothetical protein
MFLAIFAVVSLYVVDMFAYYTNTLFEYLSLYIKTDKIHLILVTYCVGIVATFHMSNNRQVSVTRKRLVDFMSMVT